MISFRVNRIFDEAHFPFQIRIDNRTLDQLARAILTLHPFKAALPIRVAQQSQIVSLGRSSRATGAQIWIRIGCPVTILTPNLNRIGHFAIDQTIAMRILFEMTIGALHAFFGVNAHHMNRFTGVYAGLDKLALAFAAPFFRIIIVDNITIRIKQIAFTVTFENPTEIPPMTVIIRKLRIFQLWIEIINIAQEINIRPQTTRSCAFWIALNHFAHFGGGRIFLLMRPHMRRVAFIIPHRIAEIGIQEDVRLMHVAIHAL